MTIKEVKKIDLVDYLSTIGFQPAKISGNNYWYHSPLHDENTPSFKINRKMNRWYDFSDGKGGNIVDFGILYHNCDVSDFLQRLDFIPKIPQQHNVVLKPAANNEEDINSIKIISAHVISSYPLQKYLHTRRINQDIADKYLKEIHYQIGDKSYYALGFKNDAGGYELRNASFKGSSSPKDSTFIDNGAKDIAVFEGFFNFLSYKKMYYNQPEPVRNLLVLNSTSFFEKSLSKMQEHQQVHLFLDNDKSGQKYTQMALDLDNQKFQDERKLYKDYDDLNDWLMNIGQTHKHQIRQRL